MDSLRRVSTRKPAALARPLLRQCGKADLGMLVIILILVLVMFIQSGYQATNLYREGDLLKSAFDNQQVAILNAQKVRAQLESLAGETAVLAEQGNENAIKLVATLKAQGVDIHPPKTER